MNRLTVTASKGASEATILVVGTSSPKAPKTIATEAARLAKGDSNGVRCVVADDTTYLLGKITAKPWLVGDEDWRILGGQFAAAIHSAGLTRVSVDIPAEATQVAALAEGMVLGDYRFDTCRNGLPQAQ